jgi:hypothetical protein
LVEFKQPSQAQAVAPPKGAAASKKGAEQVQLEEAPLNQQLLVHLELFENDQRIMWTSGTNEVLFSELYHEPTNVPAKPMEYIIQARVDLRDHPDAIKVQQRHH